MLKLKLQIADQLNNPAPQTVNDGMIQFRIEIANNGQGQFFNIKSLSNSRYQIFVEEDPIGTIQLDEKDRAHCESVGCELDIPLLNSIRDAIHAHEHEG